MSDTGTDRVTPEEAIESMIACYQTKLDWMDNWIASL